MAILRLMIRNRLPASVALLLLVMLLLAAIGWTMVSGVSIQTISSVDGNIGTNSIEIDTSADLYAGGTSLLNPGASIDWVKDSTGNVGVDCLDGVVATCNEAGVTAASGGTGHWWGARVVDGIDGSDQDIFLSGGKENDTSTWSVGGGSLGSAKYDLSQVYIANSLDHLYFGMERRGNNGTTAFDFEFNQAAPVSNYIPTRTLGDVLFTFEMQGSGNKGSATPHYFIWNGTSFVEQSPPPPSLISSINLSPKTAPPWGYVNAKGEWALGSIERFEYAEAAVQLGGSGGVMLPGVNTCGGTAFVQVRTRSSAEANSDLKDTSEIFEYQFGGPTASASLSTNCLQQFTYDASGSRDSMDGTNLTYGWDITVSPTTATLSGGGMSADPNVAGLYHSTQISGTVNVILPAGVNSATITAISTVTQTGNTCWATSAPATVTVYRQLNPQVTKSSADASALSVTLTASEPTATSFQWQISKDGGTTWTNISGATTTTLTYSNFEADVTPTTTSFSIGSDSYTGKLYQVLFRVHVERNVDGILCKADSSSVTVKKVIAVDP
ncbi:MAG: hypothetical protein HYY30_08865 [Chloroflexi bacterium]|nr:hypothetical protein [Chloroflexota bacterium]